MTADAPVIEIRNLHKSYGAIDVLKGVDLGEGDLVGNVLLADEGEGDYILGDDDPPLLPVAARGGAGGRRGAWAWGCR